MERRSILPGFASGNSAGRLALLSGISLPELHQAHSRRRAGDPGLSCDTGADPQCAAAVATILAAELSRGDIVLELAVLPARYFRAGPEQKRGVESWRLSCRRRRA